MRPPVGTHGQFTVSGALRLARRIEPYEPLWFEEPTPPEAPEEMARVASQCRIPIATGERLTTKYEFARVLETGAASILQMNLGRVGGLLEAKKIAAMAEAHYAQIAPHLYCGPIVGAANIQLFRLQSELPDPGEHRAMDGFQAKLLKTPIRWEDGYVIPPSEPGLGAELDEDVAAAHPWEGTRCISCEVRSRRGAGVGAYRARMTGKWVGLEPATRGHLTAASENVAREAVTEKDRHAAQRLRGTRSLLLK